MLKGYIDIVNRNSYSLWSKKKYNWAEWTRPRNTLNKEFLETKANEARTSMITRNMPGATRRVKNTIMSFTRKGGRRGKKKLKKLKKTKKNNINAGVGDRVGTVVWYDSVDYTILERLKAYNSGMFGRFTVIFPETGVELSLTIDATRLISPSERDMDNPNFESWQNILSANVDELQAQGKRVPKRIPTNPKLIIKYYKPSAPPPENIPLGEL